MTGPLIPERVGVIPAAGLGTRAYPYTATIPKGLLEVDGKSVLQRNLELLRDRVGLKKVVLVIGYRGELIEAAFGDGSALGLELRYVHNDRLDWGLAHSLRLAGRVLAVEQQHAIAILSDEVYVGTHHERFRDYRPGSALAACGVLTTDLPRQIRRNYSVVRDGDRILRIVEKPRKLENDLLGTGTYYLTPAVFTRLEQAFEGAQRQGSSPPDWMGFLGDLVDSGETVHAIDLGGVYANVNDRDELHRANLLVRTASFSSRKVSVVVAIGRESVASTSVLRRFSRAEGVDETIACISSPSAEFQALCRGERISVVSPLGATPSFGDLMRTGMDSATGDVLVLAQDDDSFSPADLDKLLTYVLDADLVVGTRTTRQMIEQGSNMRGAVRLSHLFLAKVLEVLWWDRAPRFTDTGCVFRALWRSTWSMVREQVVTHGQEVYPEMLVEVLRARRRVIEVPVNYYNRDPQHESVYSPHQTVSTFLRILGLLLKRRWRRTPNPPRGS